MVWWAKPKCSRYLRHSERMRVGLVWSRAQKRGNSSIMQKKGRRSWDGWVLRENAACSRLVRKRLPNRRWVSSSRKPPRLRMRTLPWSSMARKSTWLSLAPSIWRTWGLKRNAETLLRTGETKMAWSRCQRSNWFLKKEITSGSLTCSSIRLRNSLSVSRGSSSNSDRPHSTRTSTALRMIWAKRSASERVSGQTRRKASMTFSAIS